jgi:hypothetical protein
VKIKPITQEEIEKARHNEEVVRLTALQIIKDFAQFGIPVDFPNDLKMAYDQLFMQLESHIYNLITNNLQRLYALLYRIDITEQMISKRQKIRFDQALPQIITDLILERELKKVLFRLYFKNQQH